MSKMEDIRTWLSSNGLAAYSPNFEEHGWDDISLLLEMSEQEIETCIPKAGHRARFRKALRTLRFRTDSVTSHDVHVAIPPDAATLSDEQVSRNSKTNVADSFVSAIGHCSTPMVLSSGRAVTIVTSSLDGPHCMIKEWDLRGASGDTGSPVINNTKSRVDKLTITSRYTEPPLGNEGKANTEDICQNRRGENEEDTDVTTVIDENNTFLSSDMLDVIQANAVDRDTDIQPIHSLNSTARQTSMCGTPVNLTIIEHSENTTIAKAPTQMTGGSSNPVDNLKDQMEMIADSFEVKDHLYVETKAFRELKYIVEETHWATVLGKPGDGKSATAAHLMLQYQDKGYEPLFVTSPQDWKTLISSNPLVKQFVVIDDMFGASYIDNRKVDEWISMIENMEKIVKKRNGNLKVICTSRRYIFTDVESAIAKFACFAKVVIVDMTDKANALSGDEKLQIFNKFADVHKIEINKSSLKKVPKLDPPHGFPHCVELFCTNAFLRLNGLSFFENPTKCVQKEIRNIKDNDPFKFLVLLLMLLNKSAFNSSYIEQLMNNPTKDETKLFKATGVNVDTAYPHIVKAVDALRNTYLKQEKNGSYSFTHESLKENVSVVYITVNPLHAAELLSFRQIVSYTNLDELPSDQTRELPTAHLPTDILVEKVTKEIVIGNIGSACKCTAWSDQNFVNEWMSYITCGSYMYSIPDCMLSVFLKKIFCSKDKTHKYFEKQILQTNLLANLLKCNMKVAVVSLLENELLQKKLHEFPIWADILQKGLDIACTNYLSKIDFDIIQSVLKSYRNDNDRRLNGSYALTQVLQYSKADCAKLLLQDTEINPNYTENCGGYFHALVNSDIGLADFQALCRCLLGKGVDVNQKARKSFYAYEEIPPIMRVVYNMTSQDIELDRLDCLVENGADIHATVSSNSSNVVAVAIENLPSEKNVHVLPKLFALGANFQNVNNNRDNALHILFNKVQDSHFQELVNYLIGVGVDISHCDTQAKVPLMDALQNDAGIDCIQTLLQRSPPKYTDRSGQGYFHYLFQSKCGYESFCSSCNVLLEAGEDINLADKEEKVPVFTFCENALENIRGYVETSSLLTYFQSVGVDFQVKAESGRNILHHLFSRPVKSKTSITVEASTSHLERKTWSISPEEDISITSIYAFLEKNFNISCFQMDKTDINPLMLAIEHRAEFTCMAELVATKQIPLQNDGNANSYFHYLARSHASDAKYDLIKSALLRNNIPYPASMPERLPHFEEELYY